MRAGLINVFAICLLLAACGQEEAKTTDKANIAMSKMAANSTSDADRAKLNYELNCQGCHLPNGEGTIGRVPKMAGIVGQFARFSESRAYLTRVPGVTNAALDNTELAEVLNYVVQTQDPENLPEDFKPFTAEEMAAGRQEALVLTAADVRSDLIKRYEFHVTD